MRPGVLYFALFVILAAQGRFISIVLTDSLGLGESEVGWVLGFGIISSLLTTPYWSLRADDVNVGCVRVLGEMVSLHLVAFAALPVAQWLFPRNSDATYIVALLSRFVSAGLISPCGSVLDAYTLQVLEDRDEYGRERLFGAVSWAIANILMGAAMDYAPSSSSSSSSNTVGVVIDPLAVCCVFLVVSTVAFLAVLRWGVSSPPAAAAVVADNVEKQPPPPPPPMPTKPSLSGFLALLRRDAALVRFLCTITLVMGCATSLVENLLFLFMRGELKASYLVCGVSVVVTVLFEIPLFFWGKRLLLHGCGGGIHALILLAMACYVSRVVVYTLVSDGWAVLAVEPLHGVTYALLQTASVAFVHSRCADEQQAQGQGLLNLFKSVGALVGTVLGSRVMEQWGSAVLFRGMACIVAVAMVVYSVMTSRCVEVID